MLPHCKVVLLISSYALPRSGFLTSCGTNCALIHFVITIMPCSPHRIANLKQKQTKKPQTNKFVGISCCEPWSKTFSKLQLSLSLVSQTNYIIRFFLNIFKLYSYWRSLESWPYLGQSSKASVAHSLLIKVTPLV